MAASQEATLPIAELSSYHNRWTIKARITTKSNLRTFNKGAAVGKVFSVELLDKHQGEIRASFFNEAADRFHDILKVGHCFVFSRGSVKIANRQFNSCNHRYELVFDRDASVTEAADDVDIKACQFSFTDLRSVQSKELPFKGDFCGVVTSFKPLFEFKSAKGVDLVKRDICIADDTMTSMEITLWGDKAKIDDTMFNGYPVVGIKGVIVKEWKEGRSGSILPDGLLAFDVKDDVSARIRSWWTQSGSGQLQSISAMSASGGGASRGGKPASLSQIRAIAESLPSDQQFYTVVSRLAMVQMTKQGERQNLAYMACCNKRDNSTLFCNRRLGIDGSCPTCGNTGKSQARINARCRFADFEDSLWMNTFHEGAVAALGMTGEECHALEENIAHDNDAKLLFEEKVRNRCWMSQPFQLTIRAKTDEYMGERRANVTVQDVKPVNRRDHGRKLLTEILESLEITAF